MQYIICCRKKIALSCRKYTKGYWNDMAGKNQNEIIIVNSFKGGAGKTTFMNAVMGYEKAEGSVVYGGRDVYEEYRQMKYEIGFVPQQDLLRDTDTVYETLKNAARLRMPSTASKETRLLRVEEVMGLLGLKPERGSLVSKLSGGQRKRLSIAVEFISGPQLFFLDEPDSGLDGVMARGLMENLRQIADTGKIVMVITHGPDRAADLFHKVVVLAKSTKDQSGHLAFFGTVEEAYGFFGTDSLEGVVRRINRTDEGGEGKADQYIEKYRLQNQ
ncbi:MAG: ABC transporter ATP-binding protein [Oscillospiraceae bacterium]|nr:ABC transporter ATP-binding protein [Oscillospiraceae bacterium]